MREDEAVTRRRSEFTGPSKPRVIESSHRLCRTPEMGGWHVALGLFPLRRTRRTASQTPPPSPRMKTMSNQRVAIFISHKVATHKRAAARIKEILEARAESIDVYICEEIPPGDRWRDWI